MYCPFHEWQQANRQAWKSAGRRSRRLLRFLESMACLAWLGPVMVPSSPEEYGPPPGHPERLAAHPPTPAERELWAGLDIEGPQ